MQPLPGGPKRQVSIGGGQMPVWNRNGSELFYAARDGMLMSVADASCRGPIGDRRAAASLPAGARESSGEIQFPRHSLRRVSGRPALSRDPPAPDAEPDGAVVVTNWTTVLKSSPVTLAAGSRFGPYEILSPLGAGGMGRSTGECLQAR